MAENDEPTSPASSDKPTEAEGRAPASEPVAPPPGRVGFASQSGAFGIAAVAEAARRGLGLSSFVSTGNKADLSGNDFLRYWETDEGTEVTLIIPRAPQ